MHRCARSEVLGYGCYFEAIVCGAAQIVCIVWPYAYFGEFRAQGGKGGLRQQSGFYGCKDGKGAGFGCFAVDEGVQVQKDVFCSLAVDDEVLERGESFPCRGGGGGALADADGEGDAVNGDYCAFFAVGGVISMSIT